MATLSEKTDTSATVTGGVKRRGLIAGAAALAIGMTVAATEKAAAANGDFITVGTSVSADNGSTTSLYTAAYTLSQPLLRVANYAVGGLAPPSNTRIGVYGFTNNNGATGPGDLGATPIGVVGVSNSVTAGNIGIGVYGQSNGYGVVGATTGSSFGLYGLAFNDFSAAFAGGTNNPNAYACILTGRVIINGPLVVTGAKSAAVAHPDGSHRLVYCVESPDSWLEDFGTGTITAGKAEVKLDHDFAAVIDPKEMHVFFTENGDNNSLHLAGHTAEGFTVQASAGALAARGQKTTDVNGTFSYRVVAKRKDVVTPRLGKVEIPKIKLENPIGDFVVGKSDNKGGKK